MENTLKPNQVAQTIRIDILPRFDEITHSSGFSDSTAEEERTLLNADDYQYLFQNSYDATLLTNTSGQVMIANARAEEMLQCDEQHLCEMSMVQIVSGLDQQLLDSIVAQLDRARFMRISAWVARLSGDPFPAEIAVSRLMRQDTTLLSFFIRDETVRRKAEDDLRTIYNTVQNAGTGMAVADTDGRLIHINPALRRMWQLRDDVNAVDLSLADLVGEVTATAIMQICAPGSQTTWNQEIPLHLGDDDPLWVQVSAAINLDPDNIPTGVVLSFLDVSDRMRAEAIDRLRDRDRVMAQSLGAVCHHLGQPTTVLLSSIEMLRSIKEDDKTTLETLLEISLEAAEEVRQILRRLNDLDVYNPVAYASTVNDETPSEIVSLGGDETTVPAATSQPD
ncbi:MAG: PAS domain-containing protein [Lentisphaerae bacterium]|jgi:PAS domain S-box-containing protein|nr:PAS domain-containing protein [Lentisphaerota bacterium]